MSLFARRDFAGATATDLIVPRPGSRQGGTLVTNETALRHSAVWACLRLRANLISTLPVDVYRRVNNIQTLVGKPQVLRAPGGEGVDLPEWLYSTQFDLDRAGNGFGIITEIDARYNLPARIDLVDLSSVTARIKDGEIIKFRIGRKEYDPAQIWHEKQYTVAGFPLGLSPVAYAAWSIGEYLSIQEFALDWFGKGGIPAAELKNTARKLQPGEAQTAKAQFKASVTSGDLFVHGSDWEYKPIQAEQTAATWLDAKQHSLSDIARFFDVPGDLIDAVVTSGHVTYANIVQRNLQLLIMHIGPAVIRRENALSKLTPAPQFVKLNADALLRLDPDTRATMIAKQIAGRWLAPSEARQLEDRQPFTEAQLAEFDRLFGNPRIQPTTAISGAA